MKSYWGVSHLNYPSDPEGFIGALGYREIWPLIGLVLPLCTMLFTRGFDITWHKEQVPPMWYAGILIFSGGLFPFIYSFRNYLFSKIKRQLRAKEDVNAKALLVLVYRASSSRIWNLYYVASYISDITIFLKTTTMGWGISSIIYFAIGRV